MSFFVTNTKAIRTEAILSVDFPEDDDDIDEDDDPTPVVVTLATDDSDTINLSLADGRRLLAYLQTVL